MSLSSTCYFNIIDEYQVSHNITKFYCIDKQLYHLPELPISLKYLNCQINYLTILPSNLPYKLEILYCSNNYLSELPQLPLSTQLLNCSNNYLTELPELPTEIIQFICFNNNIKYLSPHNLNIIRNLIENNKSININNNPFTYSLII